MPAIAQRLIITASVAVTLSVLVAVWVAAQRPAATGSAVTEPGPVAVAQPAPVAAMPAPAAPVVVEAPPPPTPVVVEAPAPPRLRLPKVDFQNLVQPHRGRSIILQYAHDPDIYIIDFASLAEQGLAMNRIMALEEDRDGPRDRVMSSQEFAQLLATRGADAETFNYAHNYDSSQLARFFNLAVRDAIALNEAETELRKALFDLAILVEKDGVIHPDGRSALITLPQANDHISGTISKTIRANIAQHELSHGFYSLDETYRRHVRSFWNTHVPEEHKRHFRAFLAQAGYDTGNAYLVANEWQAYIIHTNHPDFFSAADVGLTNTQMAALRRSFVCGIGGMDFLLDVMPRIATYSSGQRIDCEQPGTARAQPTGPEEPSARVAAPTGIGMRL